MLPVALESQASKPPPAYHRMQARLGAALLTLCWLAVRLAHRRRPPLPAGPGGAPAHPVAALL